MPLPGQAVATRRREETPKPLLVAPVHRVPNHPSWVQELVTKGLPCGGTARGLNAQKRIQQILANGADLDPNDSGPRGPPRRLNACPILRILGHHLLVAHIPKLVERLPAQLGHDAAK